jgi:hypothetical protein
LSLRLTFFSKPSTFFVIVGSVKPPRAPFVFPRTIVVACWLLPIICAAYIVAKHAVPVPFWDEWETPGAQIASYYRGTLTFAELCGQHNEHRLLFPRLIFLPLALVAGWDVRLGMAVTLGLLGLGSAGLYRLLRLSGEMDPIGRAVVFGSINLILFSPRQYETLVVGAQGQTFLPTFALVLALLVNLSGKSLAAKTLANAALAHISTYSFGNGMLVWLLAVPLETRSRSNGSAKGRQVFWRAIYGTCAALSIGSYFISYQHPPLSPALVSPTAETVAFLRFVLLWSGSLFTVGAPLVLGGIVLLLFLLLTGAAIRQMRRDRSWRPYYPWLALGSFSLISGGIAAATRLGFSYTMAGDARYAAFSAFLYIAVLGLGFSVYVHAPNRPRSTRLATPAAMMGLVLVLTFWILTFKKEKRFLREWTRARNHSLLVLRWAEAIPQNPEIASLSPYPDTPSVIHILAEHDAFRPRLIGKKMAAIVTETLNSEREFAGHLEQTTPDTAGQLLFKGQVRWPDQPRAADCVVLGIETASDSWKPLCVVETSAGDRFSQTIDPRNLPRDAIRMRACVVDLDRERALPLAGTITLNKR